MRPSLLRGSPELDIQSLLNRVDCSLLPFGEYINVTYNSSVGGPWEDLMTQEITYQININTFLMDHFPFYFAFW